MDKFLILKGCAGLGNRLFTLINALSFCESSNRKLYVDWSDGQFAEKKVNIFSDFFTIKHPNYIEVLPQDFFESNDFYPKTWINNCEKSVYDLFQVGKPGYFVKNFPSYLLTPYYNSRKSQLWVNKNFSSSYGFFDLFNKNNMSFGSGIPLQIKSKYIFYSDFLPRINNLSKIKFIVLKKEIKSEIEKWCLKYNLNKEFLGVHVRHTDKTPIKSINYLVEMIKEKHSSLSIFLSTDSHEVERKFKIEFKDKLLIYPKETNNKGNNKRGIHMWGMDNKNDTYKSEMLRFSIIDMWLLSKCKFLIFQSNSSFSLFSKYLMSENQNSYGW